MWKTSTATSVSFCEGRQDASVFLSILTICCCVVFLFSFVFDTRTLPCYYLVIHHTCTVGGWVCVVSYDMAVQSCVMKTSIDRFNLSTMHGYYNFRSAIDEFYN